MFRIVMHCVQSLPAWHQHGGERCCGLLPSAEDACILFLIFECTAGLTFHRRHTLFMAGLEHGQEEFFFYSHWWSSKECHPGPRRAIRTTQPGGQRLVTSEATLRIDKSVIVFCDVANVTELACLQYTDYLTHSLISISHCSWSKLPVIPSTIHLKKIKLTWIYLPIVINNNEQSKKNEDLHLTLIHFSYTLFTTARNQLTCFLAHLRSCLCHHQIADTAGWFSMWC